MYKGTHMEPKKLHEQTIVITGASSGIGLATANMAAEKGAKVVLAARDEESLRRAVEDIRAKGGQATYAVVDVADPDAVRAVAEKAISEFGGFDTWVNGAGISIYGEIEKVPLEDARRLFDTNYWGVVNGSLVAVEHLKRRKGVLVNIGSVLSERAIPLQGHYGASKHAVKAFTDSLRMELEKQDAPIWVTLVKPSSIGTPYPQHAKNFMDEAATLPPPVYAPEEVARTILAVAEDPVRDVTVGAGGAVFGLMENLAPRATDRFMEASIFDQQKWEEGPRTRSDALHAPVPGSGRVHGDVPRHLVQSSLYTRASLNPGKAALLAAGVMGLGLFFGTRR